MQVPWTGIIDPYAYQITEKTYPYQRHVPVSAYYMDTPRADCTSKHDDVAI